MKLLQRIKESLSTKAHYPDQQLTDKQLELLDAIDSYLVDNCAMPTSDEVLDIRLVEIPIMSQFMTVAMLTNLTVKSLGDLESYIPRSIAFTTSGSSWQIYCGFRSNKTNAIDPVTALLYSDCLTRTNAARS